MSHKHLRLAVDCGGSSAWYGLYDDLATSGAQDSLRGANYNTEGRSGLLRLLRDLGDAVADAEIATIGLAMAGVGRPDTRTRALADLRLLLPEIFPMAKLFLFDDAEAAYCRVLGARPGVVISAGTGSVAQMRLPDGRMERAGGWGSRAGDEGSGYWIAVRALSSVFRSLDGRQPQPRYTRRLLAATGASEPYELVNWAQSSERSPAEVAALEAIVDQAAETGDPEACDLLEEAAQELAALALHLLDRGDFGSDPLVGISGSVLLKSRLISKSFQERVTRRYPRAEFVRPGTSHTIGVARLLEDRVRSETAADISAPL